LDTSDPFLPYFRYSHPEQDQNLQTEAGNHAP